MGGRTGLETATLLFTYYHALWMKSLRISRFTKAFLSGTISVRSCIVFKHTQSKTVVTLYVSMGGICGRSSRSYTLDLLCNSVVYVSHAQLGVIIYRLNEISYPS